jgi:restriction endonuclease HindI-like protein
MRKSRFSEEQIVGVLKEAEQSARVELLVPLSGAKLRAMVKRILRKCGYPPDKQERATQTVLRAGRLALWASTIHIRFQKFAKS